MNPTFRPWAAAGITLGALAAAALIVTTLVARADDKPSATASAAAIKPALTVTATVPQRSALPLRVPATGTIAAWQETLVGAESNGWRLAEVTVNVGDRVRRGQVLARFAAELPRAELAQQQAALAEGEAQLADARADAQRARELQATGALSAQQIQQLLTAERTAEARLAARRAAVEAQQVRLTFAQVLAPDDGVISARTATVGAVVASGQELFRLIRQGRLEWRAEVAATDLQHLRPGQVVQVMPSGAPPLAGKLRVVAPAINTATRNGLVYVDLPTGPAASAVRAGMFARGEFDIGSSEALTLPQTAVQLRDGFAWVHVIAADQKVRLSKVAVGRRVGERIEITEGLAPDARVVAAGGGFLADGDQVRVVDAPRAGAPAASAAKR
ncbi:efflux RND transporter periplasmic adaptor subunit [Pseudorhodoferax sp.]|uniref:efflux RND transporter periplasmic adaptor subunit n=1 Tax=Pseudorhodoferax sp. TaxID=1993553 RepID=UPI002DD66629|nr:efflux RND transporter periplasmic adaptor subunit [Pseudorhodoferax sp.]